MTLEKIMLLGPDYYNFMSAAENAFISLGYNTSTFPLRDYSLIQKSIMKMGCPSINSHIINKHKAGYAYKVKEYVSKNKIDMAFIMNANFLDTDTLDYLCNKTTVAIWLFDNISKMPEVIENLKHCDYVFSFDKNDIKTLEKNGINASFLPQACDTGTYYPIGNCKKDIDILFVGNLYFYPNRQSLIKKVIESFPERRIKVIGEYKPWYKGIIKCLLRERRDIYTNHSIAPKDVNTYYNRSKIVLNIHREDQKDGANPRLFEICGSGAYQISDSNPYIESIFHRREIGLFRTADELIDAISNALDQDKSFCAQSARKIVMENYTYECLAKQVIAKIVNDKSEI